MLKLTFFVVTLLTHRPYNLEYVTDIVCFNSGLKELRLLSIFGVILILTGEALRKGAMFNAQNNFNHYVQHVKEEGHELVTHGLYSICRHPSYVGWFYWSVGTQVRLIGNWATLWSTFFLQSLLCLLASTLNKAWNVKPELLLPSLSLDSDVLSHILKIQYPKPNNSLNNLRY